MRVKEVNLGRESETKNEHVGISSGTSNTVCTVLTSATGMEKTDIATRMESIESERLFRIPGSCESRESVEVIVDHNRDSRRRPCSGRRTEADSGYRSPEVE